MAGSEKFAGGVLPKGLVVKNANAARAKAAAQAGNVKKK